MEKVIKKPSADCQWQNLSAADLNTLLEQQATEQTSRATYLQWYNACLDRKQQMNNNIFMGELLYYATKGTPEEQLQVEKHWPLQYAKIMAHQKHLKQLAWEQDRVDERKWRTFQYNNRLANSGQQHHTDYTHW